MIIDDDVELTKLVTECLDLNGYDVVKAHDGILGCEKVKTENPDLVLLDVMLPGNDGFSLCKQVRQFSHVPIIMLTARGGIDDRVKGLELGADDYLPKPFDSRELIARIITVLRRTVDLKVPSVVSLDGLVIDFNKREVLKSDQLIYLTSAEFDLLALLINFSDKPVDRDQVSEVVLGTKWKPDSRSVDIIMSRLRKKIGRNSDGADFIKTIRGVGYTFMGRGTLEQIND